MIEMRCNMTSFGYVTPFALTLAPCDINSTVNENHCTPEVKMIEMRMQHDFLVM